MTDPTLDKLKARLMRRAKEQPLSLPKITLISDQGVHGPFQQDVIRIGALPTSEVVLPHAMRMHAVIEVTGTEVRVIRVGGTLEVDGKFVESHAQITHGARLQIGTYECQVMIDEPAVSPTRDTPSPELLGLITVRAALRIALDTVDLMTAQASLPDRLAALIALRDAIKKGRIDLNKLAASAIEAIGTVGETINEASPEQKLESEILAATRVPAAGGAASVEDKP